MPSATTQSTFVNNPVLFGILTQDQVEQVMQQSPVWLLPSNTSLSSVQMSSEVSFAMASSDRARKHLQAPANMLSLRRMPTERRKSRTLETPSFSPQASTSRLPSLSPEPARQPSPLFQVSESDSFSVQLPKGESSGVPSQIPALAPKARITSNGLPVEQPSKGPQIQTPRTLTVANDATLVPSKTRKTSASSQPFQPEPALSFAKGLRPPPNASLRDFVSSSPPMKRASKAKAKEAEPSPSQPRFEQNGLSTPTKEEQRQLEDKPVLSSPPPPGSTPTKSAMKPKSWADLLRKDASPSTKRVSIALPNEEYFAPEPKVEKPLTNGVNGVSRPPANEKKSLDEVLQGVEWQSTTPPIYPRGIINTGNMCFENSIFQVLLYCAPFYNLIRLVGQFTTQDLRKTKLMDATINFMQEFKVQSNEKTAETVDWSEPFVPDGMYEALRANKRFEVMQSGQQEDAQEFLGYFLDTLHEELLALAEKKPNGIQQEDGDEWLEVGSKGRTATTRTAETKDSALTRIFGGKQRSVLRAPGQKDSAIVEPFLTLGLDVQPPNVESIEDALANLTQPESISGYVVRGGIQVEASKQLFLESLPPVLVLHLKRFSYTNAGGTMKNHKVVSYGTTLEISPAILASSKRQSRPVKYELNAVVYHHGKSATGGHYTASIRQTKDQWLNFDDTLITSVSAKDVAVDRLSEVLRLSLPSSREGMPDRSAYLLFYQRV